MPGPFCCLFWHIQADIVCPRGHGAGAARCSVTWGRAEGSATLGSFSREPDHVRPSPLICCPLPRSVKQGQLPPKMIALHVGILVKDRGCGSLQQGHSTSTGVLSASLGVALCPPRSQGRAWG